MTDAATYRQRLAEANRIVVKIGSRVLVQRTGRPDRPRLRSLVKDIAALRHAGREIVVVSSGAIGAGMQALGQTRRPTTIPDLQMAAAVGQSRLMATYDRLFSAEKCRIGQILLTHGDLHDRQRHLNARNTMMNLLRHGIIPVVNENDAVAVDEIKFGDNDMLAALVAILIPADVLVLLTTADGFREPIRGGKTRRLGHLAKVTPAIRALATGATGPLSTGGMASKLEAASTAADMGIPVVIANGRRAHSLNRILSGHDVGTLLSAKDEVRPSTIRGRKRWIAHFHRAHGALLIDNGARDALCRKGTSLLPIGITDVEGRFDIGALVNVRTEDGTTVARGLVEYGSDDILRIKGHKTEEIRGILGSKDYDEVIHRDNMVVLES